MGAGLPNGSPTRAAALRPPVPDPRPFRLNVCPALSPRPSRQAEIEKLKGKLTGVAEEGEKIKLKIVPFGDLWCPPGPRLGSAACVSHFPKFPCRQKGGRGCPNYPPRRRGAPSRPLARAQAPCAVKTIDCSLPVQAVS
jgi:hypothetical protein